MENDLMAKLLSIPELAALSNRIYWLAKPQGEKGTPYLVLTKLNTGTQITNDGDDGLHETSIQFDCWATSYEQSLAISRPIKTELVAARFEEGLTKFTGVFLDNEREGYEDFEAVRYYRSSIDLRFWYREILSS